MDPDRLIYDLKEIKPILSRVFFYKREFIRYGYRANPDMTFGKCTKTLVMCHCETGNIWSHLLAGIYFAVHLMLLIARAIEIDTGKAIITENNSDNSLGNEAGTEEPNTTSIGSSYNPYSKFYSQDQLIT